MIEDSRLKTGTLTLDGQPFGKQATSVELSPTTSKDGDDVETLTGDTLEAVEETDWTLDLGVIQDFTDPAGLIEWARAHAGDVVPFTWRPSDAASSPTYTGTTRVRPIKIGGNVNARLNSETSWPVIGEPDSTYPAP